MNCKPGRHENQWTVGHRMTGSPEYKSWQAMRSRCENAADKDYAKYGGRGIAVCARWASFSNFILDMGIKPSVAHTLDRENNDGPYSPENCRWATKTEQTRNRRNAVNVTLNGVTKPLKVWCDELGVNYFTAHRQLRRMGRTAEQVFGGAQ